MKKKNIALVGAYGGCNLGDDAIINTVISSLEKEYKIDFYGFFDNENMYWKDNKVLECKNRVNLYDSRKNNISNIINILFKKKYHKLILVGGGYYVDKFLNSRVLTVILLLKFKSEKIYFTGQTITRFTNFYKRFISNYLMKKASIIGAREKYTYKLLSNYKNTILTGDDIFLDYYENYKRTKRDYVVINVNCYSDLKNVNEKMEEIFIESLKKLGVKIILIPFKNTKDSSEMIYNKALCNKLIEYELDAELQLPESIEELCDLLYSSKLCIGNAYHFVAYCIKSNSNFLTWYDGDYYYKKINGILDLFEIDNAILDVNDKEKAIEQILNKYDKEVNYNIENVHKNVKKCWELIKRGDD